jgi:hypothetical protein
VIIDIEIPGPRPEEALQMFVNMVTGQVDWARTNAELHHVGECKDVLYLQRYRDYKFTIQSYPFTVTYKDNLAVLDCYYKQSGPWYLKKGKGEVKAKALLLLCQRRDYHRLGDSTHVWAWVTHEREGRPHQTRLK